MYKPPPDPVAGEGFGFGFGFLRRSGAGGAAPFHSNIVYDSLASRERIFGIRIVDQPEKDL